MFKDLFMKRPELFSGVAQNFIYLMNVCQRYKQGSLLPVIKTLFTTDIREQVPFIQWANAARQEKQIVYFEPIMKALDEVFKEEEAAGFKTFIKDVQIKLSELKPLCYNQNGENFYDLVPYVVFYYTFYTDCSPYTFEEEIGTNSSYNAMNATINNFLSTYTNKFIEAISGKPLDPLKATHFSLDDFMEIVDKYIPEEIRTEKLKQFVSTTCNFDSVITLRNNELSKTEGLIEENFSDQTSKSKEYIMNAFKTNLQVIAEELATNNLFARFMNVTSMEHLGDDTNKLAEAQAKRLDSQPIKINGGDVFKTIVSESMSEQSKRKLVQTVSRLAYDITLTDGNLNLHELMQVLRCVFDDSCDFMIDSNFNFRAFNEHINEFKINSKIKPYNLGIKKCYSQCDVLVEMLLAYIKQSIVSQQDNIFSASDLSNIKITIEDLIDNAEILSKFIVPAYYADCHNEMQTISKLIPQSFEKSFRNICLKIYTNVANGMCLPTYFMCMLKNGALDVLQQKLTITFEDYIAWFLKQVCNWNFMDKLRDVLISLAFISKDGFAKFVQERVANFDSKIILNSEIIIPYVKGNNDDCDKLSIGGIDLYNSALDPSPIKRGREFITATIGTDQKTECLYNWTKAITNPTTLELLNGVGQDPAKLNSIIDILQLHHESQIHKPNSSCKMLQNYEFKNENGKVSATQKFNYYWCDTETLSKILKFKHRQTITEYIDDEFKARQLVLDSQYNLIPKPITKNKIEFASGHKTDVSMVDSMVIGGDNIAYLIPYYKFVGEIKAMSAAFAKPPSKHLAQFNLDSSTRVHNATVFLFGDFTYDSGFYRFD